MALRDPRHEHDDAERAGAPPRRPKLEVVPGSENADLVPERPLDAARGIVIGVGLSVVFVGLPLAALLYRWLRG